MLDRVGCSREQFSFQMCLESGDGSTSRNLHKNCRQRVPDRWCRDAECFGLEVDDWRISEYLSCSINCCQYCRFNCGSVLPAYRAVSLAFLSSPV